MSFGINGPDNIPSIQKSHHTNDGGAGNLGYFQQQKKKKEGNNKDENDIFEFSSKKDKEEEWDDETIEVESIRQKIRGFWKSLHESLKEEKNPEEE
jgi:hypothetical protein